MKTIKKISLFSIILFVSTISFSENEITSNSNSAVTSTMSDSNQIDSSKHETTNSLSELDYYKMLYNDTKNSTNSYINLIQWVLGICITIILAILLSQIFFNYRINKHEVDFIKKDIDEKISKLNSTLLEKIDSEFKRLKTENNSVFDNFVKQVNEKVDYYIKSKSELLELRTKTVEEKLNFELKRIETEVLKNTGELWRLKGVESNALSNFIRSAFNEIHLNFEVKYTLDSIIGVLKKLDEIHKIDYDNLDILTSKLQETHSARINQIRELYKEKPVYIFEKNIPGSLGDLLGFSAKSYVKNKK